MGMKAETFPDRVDDVSADVSPVLSEQIQKQLGSLLAAAYTQDNTELSAKVRFAELLAKLDIALSEAGARHDAEVRRLLVAVLTALHRFAVSLARDPTAADDLVQDTVLRAWRARLSFEPGTNFEAWTFTILRNLFYSSQRKPREIQDDDGSYTARLASPPNQTGRLDLQDVRGALDRLAPVMREALVLVAIESLTYEEAATIMDCQVGTVKSRVWRARDQLARMLGYNGTDIGNDGVMLSALSGLGEVNE